MKTILHPEQFTFTNRFGGPHFNKSLLQSRISMMNRQSSWRSWWRYGGLTVILSLTWMCQPLVKSESVKEESEVIKSKEVITSNTIYIGDTMVTESYKEGKIIDRVKIWDFAKRADYTWTGDMNQLMEASFFKRKQALLYVRPNHYLDLYDEYKKSITVFVDGQQVTLKELQQVHIRQIAKVYAHKRSSKEDLLGIVEDYSEATIDGQKPTPKLKVITASTRQPNETDYVIWIDRTPNRMKRDSTIHVVSPFYTGAF